MSLIENEPNPEAEGGGGGRGELPQNRVFPQVHYGNYVES